MKSFNKNMEYRDLLENIASMFEINTYVEIGILAGETLKKIAPHVNRAIGVDKNLRIKSEGNIELYEMKSEDFIKQWHEPIDMLFIDGDHSEDNVFQDLSGLFNWVVPETGLIFLHDTFPIKPELLSKDRSGDAWKVARKVHLFWKQDCEIVTLPGPWGGISILRKLRNGKHGWMEV